MKTERKEWNGDGDGDEDENEWYARNNRKENLAEIKVKFWPEIYQQSVL